MPQQLDNSMSIVPSGGASGQMLVQALLENNSAVVKQLLQQRADVNYVETGPARRTPLLHILERNAATIDNVYLLLKAKANVNATMSRGRTPLHLAIQHYLSLPPVVIRMLMCNKADINLVDDRGVTPIDALRLVFIQQQQQNQQGQQQPGARETSLRVRQLLSEATDSPTIDVVVLEGQPIQRALFADRQSDIVAFSTESSIGLYSMQQKKVTFLKKLKQQQVHSTVKNIAVNPEFGTIAVCLELLDTQTSYEEPGKQNVFIVWPNGQLSDEEPLKLSIRVDPTPGVELQPACVMLSRSAGPQLLLGRLVDGKIFCWQLNAMRSQLVSETEITKHGGLLAVSDNGAWIAVVDTREEGRINIYTYGASAKKKPDEVVATMSMAPKDMAIQAVPGDEDKCFLAIAPAVPQGATQYEPIQVFEVSNKNEWRHMYRIMVPCLCHQLNFCQRSTTHIMAACCDGSIVVYDMDKSTTSMCHDSPNICPLDINENRTMIIAPEANYFRILKVPSPEHANA